MILLETGKLFSFVSFSINLDDMLTSLLVVELLIKRDLLFYLE